MFLVHLKAHYFNVAHPTELLVNANHGDSSAKRKGKISCFSHTIEPSNSEGFSSQKARLKPLDPVESPKIKSAQSSGCGGALCSSHTSSGESCLSFSGNVNTFASMYASPSNTSTDYFEVLNPTLSRKGHRLEWGVGGSEIVISALSNNI